MGPPDESVLRAVGYLVCQPRTDEVADSHSDGLEESDIIVTLTKRSGSVTHFGKVGYHVILLEDSF